MSKGDTFENDLLKLIFNNVDIADIGDAAGLQNSVAAGNLYVSLHTGSVGESGNQTTNEATYTGYTRKGVTRTTGGWTVTNNTVQPVATISFPSATGGTNTITNFAIGTSLTGTGKVLYHGSLSPVITVTSGVTPELTTATTVVED
jgi:hypothetical protein